MPPEPPDRPWQQGNRYEWQVRHSDPYEEFRTFRALTRRHARSEKRRKVFRRLKIAAIGVVGTGAGFAVAWSLFGLSPWQFKRAGPATQPSNISVIDGDTIDAVVPPGRDRRRYRLVGFDTPETYYARCDAERVLGDRAKRRLEELLARADVRIEVQGNNESDRYGRGLATLRVGGSDAGQILIREGLAVAYSGRGQRIDWCAKLSGK